MLIATSFVLLFVLFQATGEVSAAEGIATGIAGLVAPILAQVVKKIADTSGFKAMLVSVVASAVVALLAMYIAGEITSVGDAVKQVMAVFGIATVVYNTIGAASKATQ